MSAFSKMKSLIHHHIWQRIPYRLRRRALFTATSAMAPRISTTTRPAQPIIVAGALCSASGLGESARLCYEALRAAGVPVLGVDISSPLMQPLDADFAFADGRNVAGPATLILHVNSPLVPFALWRLGARLLRDKYVIGYWAWELPQVPDDWRHGIQFVHEIWVPSAFTAAAVRPIAGQRPVRIVPHPVAVRGGPAPVRADGGAPFTVLTIFNAASSIARKNPAAVVAAFQKAFGDDATARLIIKASNLDVAPSGREQLLAAIGSAANITLIEHTMSAAAMDQLFAESDVVISLHRSEGFGLTIAEAMLRGIPAIATNWSGNVDFLTADTGRPVDFKMVPSDDPQGTYHYPEMQWADADVEDAARALRQLRDDPALAARLGEAGRAFARQHWTGEHYARIVLGHLGLEG
ncbi:MAG: glycosyltransferase family 4 protein [Hyphomicrobium sp.]